VDFAKALHGAISASWCMTNLHDDACRLAVDHFFFSMSFTIGAAALVFGFSFFGFFASLLPCF